MKVFVSHFSGDSWVAQQMVKELEAVGAETFLDAFDIESGDDIEDVIRDHLDTSDEFVVLLTPAALMVLTSGWRSAQPGRNACESSACSMASRRMTAYVVLVSDRTLASSWVNFEIGAAMATRKPVFPVYLTYLPPTDVPAVFSHAEKSVRATTLRPDEVAEELVDAIKKAA